MNRSGSFLMLLLMALAVFAVVYLLFGDALEDGAATSGYAGGDGSGMPDLLGSAGASLETKGTAPKTAEELAAERARAEAAARKVTKEEGVFGIVTDARDRPIAGATVTMILDPPGDRRRQGVPDSMPLATATTNDDGEYVVGPSPTDDPHVKIRAEAGGYAASVQRVRRIGVRVDFILDKGGRLDLRVIDVLGKPVAGATAVHQAGNVVSAAPTDEEGHARFASLPTGTGTLVVTKDGYGAVRDQNVAVAPGKTETRTLVLPKGTEISGSVVDGETQRPLAGVVVSLRYPQLPTLNMEPFKNTKTDEEGRFKISADVSGQEQVSVHAVKDGFAEGRMWRNAQSKGDLEFKLFKTGEALEGRVVDADNQPVGGVSVTYAWLQNEPKHKVPSAETQEDGTFVLALPAWAGPGSGWTVVATSAEHGLGTKQVSVPRKGQPPAKQVEIQLGGTGSISGTVKDGGGQPVQGAVVSLTPDWKTARESARAGTFNWQVLNVINNGQHHNLSAVTGMDGTYTVTGVPALAYQVMASFGLDQHTLPEAVVVREGDEATADIALGEGGTIEGWILDSDGKPVVGAYVSANPANNRRFGWWRRRPSGRSQSDGRFVLRGVTDDTYNMWAYAAGYGSAQHKNARQGDTEIQIRLKALGWIEGVVSKEGRPYAGMFTVMARPVQGGNRSMEMMAMSGRWFPGQQQRTFNTSDGRFQVKGLQAGDYTVQVSTNDGLIALQEDVVTVMDGRGSREAQLELTEGARVTGTVRDDETGRGVPNAWVNASGKSATGQTLPSTYGRTDAKGAYELKGLGAGTYTISAYVGGSQVSEQVDLAQSERRTLDLVKRSPGSIHFTVLDEKGEPLADARPNIQSATGSYVGVNTTAMRRDGLIEGPYDWRALWNTNAEGVLVRYHVPPGVVTVWATKSGYTPAGERQQVDVRTGRMTEVVIRLKKRGAPAPRRPGMPPPPPAIR